jgi:hypothetical protein
VNREKGELGVLAAAEFTGQTTIYVVGSQAVYGSLPDLDLAIVAASTDLDFFTLPHYEGLFFPAHATLGDDSEFHHEHDFYVEMVRPTLPRLPEGWELRAVRRVVGEIDLKSERHAVTAVYPELHDLAVSKLVVGRPQDIRFLEGLAERGYLQRDLLLERLSLAPRVKAEERVQALGVIDELIGPS